MKVSIIIPVYNNPEELEMTMKSIVGQTLPSEEMEVIVVDDGSQIEMKSVLLKYQNKIQCKYYYQEDRGFCPGTARNIGIKNAKGEICLFIDCGVVLVSDCVSKHYERFQATGDKCVVFGYVYGNDTHSDLKLMRQIIDTNTPDAAAALMEEHKMLDGREKLYSMYGDDLNAWPAPWIALWSLHFSVSTEFMRKKGIFFDPYFTTWGGEDNEFGIQLQIHGADFCLAREAKAMHYPPDIRSYDKLRSNPEFMGNFKRNKQYIKNKYPQNRGVALWCEISSSKVNQVLIDEMK